jgi:hypothetical protein
MKTKYSFGLGICKYSDDGYPSILICKKRVSYEFLDFVRGVYPLDDNYTHMKILINKMNKIERDLIETMDFTKIWWHAYHESIISSHAINCENKFYNTYSDSDTKKKLTELLNSVNHEPMNWDLPKGKRERGDLPVDTAIRETQEEVNLYPTDYKFLSKMPIIYEIIEYGVRYILMIFIVDYIGKSNTCVPDGNEIIKVSWLKEKDVDKIEGVIKELIVDILNNYKSLPKEEHQPEPCKTVEYKRKIKSKKIR